MKNLLTIIGRYVNYIRISYSSKIALTDGTIKVLEGYYGNLLCITVSYIRHCNILIFLV